VRLIYVCLVMLLPPTETEFRRAQFRLWKPPLTVTDTSVVTKVKLVSIVTSDIVVRRHWYVQCLAVDVCHMADDWKHVSFHCVFVEYVVSLNSAFSETQGSMVLSSNAHILEEFHLNFKINSRKIWYVLTLCSRMRTE
jgi:hypothetical protein